MINLVQQREREVGAVRLKLEHQTVRAVHNVVVVGVHIANDRPVQDPVLDRRTLRRHGHVARRHNRRADNRARLPSRRKIERERRRLVRPNRHRRRQRRRRDLRREGLAALVVARRAKDVVRIGIGRVEVRQRVLLHPNHNRRRVVVDRNVVLDIHRHRRRQHHAVAVGIRRQECARQVQRKRLAVVVRRRDRQVINLVQQREREVGAVGLKLEHQTVRAVHNVVVVGVHIANDRPVQDPVLDRRTLRRHGHVARRHNRRADNRARLPSRRKIERERRRLVRPNRHRRRQRRRRDLRREGLAALVVARRAKDVVRIGIGRVEVRQRVLLHPNHNRRRVVVDRNVVLDIHRHRRRQHHAVAVGIRRQECARQVQRKRLAVVVRRRVRQVINLVQQREREVGAVRLKLEHQTVRAVHNVVVVGVHIANDRPVQDPVLDRRTLRRHGHVARRHNRRAWTIVPG